MKDIENLMDYLRTTENKRFSILNIIEDAYVGISNSVDFIMKQHEERMSRHKDKTNRINEILDSFDFSGSKAGQLFIHQGYYIGDDYYDIRDSLTSYYFNQEINESDIEIDVKSFFLLFQQRNRLLNMLHKDEDNNIQNKNEFKREKEVSEILLNIFKNDKVTLTKFLSRIKGKSGVKVVIEVQALMKLNKVRKEDVQRPLWREISKIQNIGSESNWNTVLGKKHLSLVNDIISEY